MKTTGGASATARLKNPGTISLEALQSMAKTAGTVPLTVQADSMSEDGKSVDVRISFNPAKATKSVDISASTTSMRAKNTKALFEKWFNSKVSVISCAQQGSFGMDVEIAAKIDPVLDTKNLIFYTYDRSTNSYKQIVPAPRYWMDSNGYVHFVTQYGGDIIIADKPLQKKNVSG